MKVISSREFRNGKVHAIRCNDGMMIETTDTFLPFYTKYCVNGHSNELKDDDLGDRSQRWMIGVSTMSGCPCRCQFCATGAMPKWRNLSSDEIVGQVLLMTAMNSENVYEAKEFKINYTRMGEPFLNIDNVKEAIRRLDKIFLGTRIHHYVSTIGIKDSDFGWIKDNITLQVSLHSCNDERRDELIPFSRKMTIEELGQIRTQSELKVTLNMTLVEEGDFDIDVLKQHFKKDSFFIKLSPINKNEISEQNNLGGGIIQAVNIQ